MENLSRFTADDIASFIDWDGDPAELIKTLVECRWLDEKDGCLSVHDWAEHCPGYVHERTRKREQRQMSRDIRDSPRTVPGHSRKFQDIPGMSAPYLT